MTFLAPEVFDPKAKARAFSESFGFLWTSRKEVLAEEEAASDMSITADAQEDEEQKKRLPSIAEQGINGVGPRQVYASDFLLVF